MSENLPEMNRIWIHEEPQTQLLTERMPSAKPIAPGTISFSSS
jgi:hypothetical protein